MKANPSIDELLCSFIDGELPPRQQTEVQRLMARDPAVAKRLKQLQDCQTLLSSLPRADAPAGMFDQARTSLERETLLGQQPISSGTSAGARGLLVRKCLAAAAVIALLGVLGTVIYQIVAPVSQVSSGPMVAGSPDESVADIPAFEPAAMIADSGFSGRLELRTAASVQSNAFLKRTLEAHSLASLVAFDSRGGNNVYRIACSREALNGVLTNLGTIWQNFDSATLFVDTEQFAEPVVVKSVTPQQAIKIINEQDVEQRVSVAKDFAILNALAEQQPGREVLMAVNRNVDSTRILATIPRPVLTSKEPPFVSPAQGQASTTLTIVLNSSD
jgi:hypothetical protein